MICVWQSLFLQKTASPHRQFSSIQKVLFRRQDTDDIVLVVRPWSWRLHARKWRYFWDRFLVSSQTD